MTNKQVYLNQFNDETIQVLDLGEALDLTKPIKNKKAEVIINALAGQHIGYKLDYKNLACKRFKKWVEGNTSFESKDMLAPRDVKQAVREFYRRVAVGELTWSDGEKKMLQFTRLIDGTMELKVVAFVEGLFETPVEEKKSISLVEKLAKLAILASDEESEVLLKAMDELNKLNSNSALDLIA